MQAAQASPASLTSLWPLPGSVMILQDIAAARRQKIEGLFASIDFIPDRPAPSVLDALCKLHYSQFQVEPDSYTRQVNWTPITPAKSPYNTPKARRILCVRRPNNTLEALMPVGHVLKNPAMKTGRFAYKAIFYPDDPNHVELRPAFVLTAVYPVNDESKRGIALKNLLDAEKNLRLHPNLVSTHFPRLENWGFKQGNRVFDVKEKDLIVQKKLPCQKIIMEDECLELNLAQYFDQHPHISEKEILGIIIRVLEALEKMYQGGPGKGFVHCDVKRENIILKREGGKWIAYLTDVGLATLIGSDVAYYIGTPKEWPPDYCHAVIHSKDTKYFESFDLWTVGVLAWEMLSRVHEHSQWHDLKKAQYCLGYFRAYPKLFDNTAVGFDLDKAFKKLYPADNYDSERWKQEKVDFFAKKKTYSPSLLLEWLKKKWNDEQNKFESSINQQYPTMTWLHGLLRIDPAQRLSVQKTLQQLREYHAGLPDIAPVQAPPVTIPKQPPVLPSSPQKVDDAARKALATTVLDTELNTQLIVPEESSGWLNWIWSWGKGGNCSLQ